MASAFERQVRPERVQVVERAVWLQQLVAGAESPLALRELARRANLSPTTTKRLARTLESLDLLERDVHGRYSIGGAAATLTRPAAELPPPGPLLSIVARRVVERFGESATITVDAGDAALYTHCCVSDHDVQVADVTGDTSPFHLIASGIVLMTTWNESRLQAYLGGALEMATAASMTDPAGLRQRVEAARADDFAWSVGEALIDITAVAVPVRDRSGRVVASVGLYGPSFRLDPDDGRIPSELQALVTSTAGALGL